jgi:hypothetical protein
MIIVLVLLVLLVRFDILPLKRRAAVERDIACCYENPCIDVVLCDSIVDNLIFKIYLVNFHDNCGVHALIS